MLVFMSPFVCRAIGSLRVNWTQAQPQLWPPRTRREMFCGTARGNAGQYGLVTCHLVRINNISYLDDATFAYDEPSTL